MTIIVANKRTGVQFAGLAYYIGRPSALGNPFVIGRDGDRCEVIAKYQDYFYDQLVDPDTALHREFMTLLKMIRNNERLGQDSRLICWCNPLPCHGDIIRIELERRLGMQEFKL